MRPKTPFTTVLRGLAILQWVAVATAVSAFLFSGCSPSWKGLGWTVTRLDLEVRVSNEEPSMTIGGTLQVRLDADRSFGPSFCINSMGSGIRWLSLKAPGAIKVDLNDQYGSVTLAHTRFKQAFAKGDELELHFDLEMTKGSNQLIAREDIALASWIHAWYPHATQPGYKFTSHTMSVPGTTTFRLPAGWIALSDGKLVSRDVGAEKTVEVWEQGARPVARSFTAGPFRAAERVIEDRKIRIYLRNKYPIGVERLADLLMQTMAAQEARLGEFPFENYGVVEVPNNIAGWGAASQQTFIMAKSDSFKYEHGNVPLWAHEMCHAWWGNTVGTHGPGSKMAGEALAQFGVLIALGALEGREAVVKFLEFSRSGYSAMQCARGYFDLVDEGKDHPLATLGTSSLSGSKTHTLVNSKGMWVYHMLRQRIGDQLFFGTIRQLIADFAGRQMSLDDIRRAFVAAAPDHDLDSFFAQWLDRTGAIDIEVSFSRGRGSVDLLLSQSKNKPFQFDLDLELKLVDGTTQRERVEVRGRETRATFDVPSRLVGVDLDPDRLLLMRRAAYKAMPDIEGIAESAAWLKPEVYVGDYARVDGPLRITVDAEDGALWVRTSNRSMRLWPAVDMHHRFRGTGGWMTFMLKDDRAESVKYDIDGGFTWEAVRTR